MATLRSDLTGLKVTCKIEEAVRYYNEAVQLFVGQLANYLPAVEKTLEIDPDFVMARCFQVSRDKATIATRTHTHTHTGLFVYHNYTGILLL